MPATPQLSILLPSRNERFLAPTVRDLLSAATGSIEIIVLLDGGNQYEPIPSDPRVRVIPLIPTIGMRGAVNRGVALARGRYVMKLDAHCVVSEGFDEGLTVNLAPNEIVIPRRLALDGETWTARPDRLPVDAHYLSYPWERPADPTCGLHGTAWPDRATARADVLFDEELSTQGSAYLFHRAYWPQIGPLDRPAYGPNVNEAQEWGLRCWLSGGRLVINKTAWYAHLAKGRRWGRGYVVSRREHRHGHDFTNWFWMTDRPFHGKTRSLRWLIERFWPVPTWPTSATGALDWDAVERATARWSVHR